jgi:hypothetical protein
MPPFHLRQTVPVEWNIQSMVNFLVVRDNWASCRSNLPGMQAGPRLA